MLFLLGAAFNIDTNQEAGPITNSYAGSRQFPSDVIVGLHEPVNECLHRFEITYLPRPRKEVLDRFAVAIDGYSPKII